MDLGAYQRLLLSHDSLDPPLTRKTRNAIKRNNKSEMKQQFRNGTSIKGMAIKKLVSRVLTSSHQLYNARNNYSYKQRFSHMEQQSFIQTTVR